MFCLSESSFRIDNLVRGAMGEAHGPPSLERANPEARGAGVESERAGRRRRTSGFGAEKRRFGIRHGRSRGEEGEGEGEKGRRRVRELDLRIHGGLLLSFRESA